ncbi:MAG TPA: tetratricopeptide repeat protein, partial [Aestuariivirgaceae bacterium]|nr:tetratricopeptide repeat protein [Aestuariivirgaceae bacterium]
MRGPVAVAILSLTAFGGEAAAQSPEWDVCRGNDTQKSVVACSALIDGGQLGGLDLSNAYYNRAWSYNDLRDYEKSLADYTKCAELDPQNKDCQNGLAAVHLSLSAYDDAIAAADRAIAIDARFALAYA